MCGYSKKEELIGKPLLVLAKFKEKTLRHLGEIQKRGGWAGEDAIKRKDGSVVDVQIQAMLIKNDSGSPICMQASFTDLGLKKASEEALKDAEFKLGERIKELACLYGISKLIEKPNISMEEVFEGTIKFIPPGWQYPEITCVRIITPDGEFKTDNFKDTVWKQEDDITIKGEKYGTLEVCYLEEKFKLDEGPFLKEERNLINAIIHQLEKMILERQSRRMLAENEARFRELFKNMSSGVSVYEAVDGGKDFIIRDIKDSKKMAIEGIFILQMIADSLFRCYITTVVGVRKFKRSGYILSPCLKGLLYFRNNISCCRVKIVYR